MSSRAGHKQAARVVREQLARERRRRRTFWTSVVAVAALVIAGLVGWSVYAGQRTGSYTTPPGAVDDGTGFAVGSGPVKIDVYEDFLCPACGQFEKQAGPTVQQLVSQGKVTVTYHPIAILDRYSTTQYSTRAAAASACAAQGGRFAQFHDALFAQQPAEGGPGLSDDQLVQIGASVGLTGDDFTRCLRDGTYRSWTAHVTDVSGGRGVTGTPTIYVAGKPLEQPTVQNLTAAVEAAGA